MEKVQVIGLERSYLRNIELICMLFIEDVKVVTEEEDFGYQFRFTIDRKEHGVYVHLQAEWANQSGVWQVEEERYTRTVNSEAAEETWVREEKQATKVVTLKLLERITGMEQPWGILTGVRPTKLYHKLQMEGVPKEEIARHFREDYFLHLDKIELLEEIVDRQHQALPDLYELNKEVSLYIGIPFCPTKCAYCTFPAYAIQGRTGSVEQFLQGLHLEIEAIGKWLAEKKLPVTTIYFGGGTPTSISTEQMEELFLQLQKSIPSIETVREWTVEAGRPDTLDPEKLELMKRWKIDRISINPQSFKEETLKLIGRHHSVKETMDKYELAREMGLDNINMDLIIGLPNERIPEFEESLDTMASLKPESLTVHTLSFKRGSFLTQNKEKYVVADRDETAHMVKRAREWTKEHGYVPYYLYRQKNILGNQENVGYSLPERESLYNIIIMEERHTIIGLGCGAVSKLISPVTGKLERLPNPKEPQAYINTIQHHIKEKIMRLNQIYTNE